MNLVKVIPDPEKLVALLENVSYALMHSQSLEYAETVVHLYKVLWACDHGTAKAWAQDNHDSVVPVVTAILFKSTRYSEWLRWYFCT